MKKIRLDEHLFSAGLIDSIDSAKKRIIAGWVKVDNATTRDPAAKISGMEKISMRRPRGEFASRGGEKLQRGLTCFNISVKGKNTADLGASTGGFTDCLLKNGANKVYAVDVGYGILDYSLRSDSRVAVKERTNVKSLAPCDFEEKIDFITVDLSFTSILPVFSSVKKAFPHAEGIILIKPQFEALPAEQCRGVVKNKKDHENILERTIFSLIAEGLIFKGLHYSPIKGPAGNIEFLLYFETALDNPVSISSEKIKSVIRAVADEAHEKLN